MASRIDPRDILAPRDGDTPADTRFVARLYGYRYYRTRVSCRNDHPSLRRTSTGECIRCTADRWTRWSKRHPEAARAKLRRMLTAKGIMPSI